MRLEFFQLFDALHLQAFGIGIKSHPRYPRQLFLDFQQDAEEPVVRKDQGIAVTKEHAALLPAILRRKGDVVHNDIIGFDAKPLSAVSSAEGTLVARATDSDL